MGLAAYDRIRKETDRHAKFFAGHDKVSCAHRRLPARQSCFALRERSLPPRHLAGCDAVNILRETLLAKPSRKDGGESKKNGTRGGVICHGGRPQGG